MLFDGKTSGPALGRRLSREPAKGSELGTGRLLSPAKWDGGVSSIFTSLILLGKLFLRVTRVLSTTLTHSFMGMKPVETSTDVVPAVAFSGMQEEEGLGWRRGALERKSKNFSRVPRI